ncbi:hypothetical protein AGABI1DRAFT_95343 [Agaricus bisporus var. burnettii JB137-S8]|uniref:Uncharacterized protein n=1 Tax=Agaricus bisporus var. burnettii (strain JB137-S8 / ATCC MYA-4627 / FGSC 10392) TaxID=597362 RepID=K5VKG3_AGABU|nr:uncharacterized protein AGABI1DRAFT_95343 [Agaricus bisporus var. burnettii JB137-S8]EKM74854.1 hypothetical protein AGABI1DRAFT_95343 [Agaricus bisporus var. burnettii JB137-S8]
MDHMAVVLPWLWSYAGVEAGSVVGLVVIGGAKVFEFQKWAWLIKTIDSKHKRRAETPASEAVGLLEQEAEYDADISDSDNDGPETAERWSNAHVAGIFTSAVGDVGWLKFGRGKNVEEQISMTRKEGGAEHDGTSIRRQENNEEDENALVINHGYDADDEADGFFE